MILIKIFVSILLFFDIILVLGIIPYGLYHWLSTPNRTIGEDIMVFVVCFCDFILTILGVFLFKIVFLL